MRLSPNPLICLLLTRMGRNSRKGLEIRQMVLRERGADRDRERGVGWGQAQRWAGTLKSLTTSIKFSKKISKRAREQRGHWTWVGRGNQERVEEMQTGI